MKKFMLDCRFSFEAYAKNVNYWMLMDLYLPKFDIYQATVVPNCFNSHANS